MSNYCCTVGMDRFFTMVSGHYAKRFRRKGPDKASRILVEQLLVRGVESKTILDVGCGMGDVHLTLLRRGALSAVAVDVSSGMLKQARSLSEEMGFEDRVRYIRGDLALMDGESGSADVVVMDKVLCCYPNPEILLDKAIVQARRILALSYPRRSWIAAGIFGVANRLGELLRWSFHPFYHDPERIAEFVLQRKFREVFSGQTLIWQVKVFETGEKGFSGS